MVVNLHTIGTTTTSTVKKGMQTTRDLGHIFGRPGGIVDASDNLL